MSFILDALKKSEIERQEQAGPSMSHVREARPDGRRPMWIAAIAALLAVNVIVIAFFALRTDERAARPAERETQPPATAPVAAPSPPATDFAPAEQTADRTVRPLEAEVEPRARTAPAPGAAPSAPVATPAHGSVTMGEALPTFDQLVVKGQLSLPRMHMDIHVFSDTPSSRFVFIDGRKYQEGDRLDTGPQLEEITESGVVLSHQGQRFLLPRE